MALVAILYNETLVKNLKRPSNWQGIIRHVFRDQINSSRRMRKNCYKLIGSKKPTLLDESQINWDNAITESFEAQSAHFREQGWAYIENFFNPVIYEATLRGWPRLSYFSIKPDLAKSFDRGPNWSEETLRVIEPGIDPSFYAGFRALLHTAFVKRVTGFVGDSRARRCSSLGSAWARTGHHLLPHVDNASRHGPTAVVNFVIFIDGCEDSILSGGTSIFKDNTFSNLIFAPKKLQNTAIVYGTGVDLFHGFPKVKFGRFSKRLISQYASQNEDAS